MQLAICLQPAGILTPVESQLGPGPTSVQPIYSFHGYHRLMVATSFHI